MKTLVAGLRGLTRRGRAFLWIGVGVVVLALILGRTDVLRVAVLLVALPIVAALVLVRAQLSLQARRTLETHRITAGTSARIRVRLRNSGRLPTGVLLGEDRLPAGLGRSPRFVLEHMSARWQHTLSYRVYCDLRGRYSIGPLTVRLTDPFGLVEQSSTFPEIDTLLVVPRVVPLPILPVPGEQASTGESTARSLTAVGDQDLTVREYHQGDDLRRVHWRSTARRGELMVRREEQPWRARATVLFDTRESAHTGRGLASSFEWAASTVASIAVHLAARGYGVTMVDENGLLIAGVTGQRRLVGTGVSAGEPTATEVGAEIELLDAMAPLHPSRHRGLGERDLAGDSDTVGLLIAVTGVLEPADVDGLIRMERQATSAMAVLLDVPQWRRGVETREGAEPSAATQAAKRRLQLAGFRVGVAGPLDQLPVLWRDTVLAGRSLRTSSRATAQATAPDAAGLTGARR